MKDRRDRPRPGENPTSHRVGEARIAYEATVPPASGLIESAVTRMSTKNQITLPVAMVRMLGLKPGDKVDLMAWQDVIRVERHLEGEQLLDMLQGSMAHVPDWSTKERIDEYVRNERGSWNREWDQE